MCGQKGCLKICFVILDFVAVVVVVVVVVAVVCYPRSQFNRNFERCNSLNCTDQKRRNKHHSIFIGLFH